MTYDINRKKSVRTPIVTAISGLRPMRSAISPPMIRPAELIRAEKSMIVPTTFIDRPSSRYRYRLTNGIAAPKPMETIMRTAKRAHRR